VSGVPRLFVRRDRPGQYSLLVRLGNDCKKVALTNARHLAKLLSLIIKTGDAALSPTASRQPRRQSPVQPGVNSLFMKLISPEPSEQESLVRTCANEMKMRTYLVEDNPTILENLISTLEELAPIETIGSAQSEGEGATWLTDHQNSWDMAIVDLFLKGGSGLGVLEACRGRSSFQKMVVFSNYATKEIRLRCAQLGVDAVFDKSTEIEALITYCTVQSQKMEHEAFGQH
jgi:two-component system, OmpR family, response regulator